MKRLLFLLVAFVYCNVMWQAVVWGRDFFHSFIALLLIFIVPITAGVVLFLIFNKYVNEDWSAVFVGAGILIPVIFMFTFATRMPDYVAFVRDGKPAFDGRIADVADDASRFYTLRDFAFKSPRDGHFGASYSSTSRKSSTTYSKHFVVPLFVNPDDARPRVWLFASYTTGSLRVDDGDYGIYGLDETSLQRRLRGDVVHGLRIKDSDARDAVAHYLKKMNLADDGSEPIVLSPVDQAANEFYRIGEYQFWGFTAVFNVLFLGVCFYASRGSESSEQS
jgi:hypothetical protein